MEGLLSKTISMINFELCCSYRGFVMAAPDSRDSEEFVLTQMSRMPALLRLPIRIATVAFAVTAILYGGRTFHSLPPSHRSRYLQIWRDSPFGPCRDLIRFYESLVVIFAYADLASTQGTAG